MSTVCQQTLQQALLHHQQGSLLQAEKLYRQIIRLDPNHADAHNLLGVSCHQRRQGADAVRFIQKAVALNRQAAPYHSNLGMAYRGLGKLDEAVRCYRKALNLQPDYAEARFNLGIALHDQQKFVEAEVCFRRALAALPGNSDVLINLGNSLQAQEKFSDALDCFGQILEIDANHFEAEFNLGNCLKEQECYEPAAEHFQRAVEINPGSAVAQFNLGNVLQLQDRLRDAVDAYKRSLEIDPQYIEAHNNLGGAWHGLRKFDRAIQSYERAVEIDPQYAVGHNNIGRSLHQQGKLQEALASIHRSLDLAPSSADAYLNMGEVYCSARKLDQARCCFEQVVSLDPNSSGGWRRLAAIYKLQHRLDDAVDAYHRGIGQNIGRPLPQLWLGALCPAVFPDEQKIDDCRERIHSEIARVAALRPRPTFEEIAEFGSVPPSNLQFHNRNNRPILESFASVFRGCLPDERPVAGTGKAKIGFVVSSGHEGIFYRYMGGIIERLNRDLFDPVIVCSPTGAGFIRDLRTSDDVELLVVAFRHDLLVEATREARFDVLYHFEVGTDISNYFLPFFCLAPVQCTSGGNSQTTGLEEIDYFLSSDLQEPRGADDHYTETLIRTRGLPSFQQRIVLPKTAKTREEFGFRPGQNLYACPQKLQKIGPDFDPLLNDILERDPNGVIALVADRSGLLASQLRQRFQRTMPNVIDRVVFVPRLSIPDYLGLTAAADVLLDPLHYVGGSTMYDSLSFNKPVVTLPGEFVRGRYTLGFYRKMSITSCIASSPEEYVDTAVALGTDADFRRSVEEEIASASPVIFEDPDVVPEYERIFLQLVEEARKR
jgi:tetratricopeptide (TPR) repeat protein